MQIPSLRYDIFSMVGATIIIRKTPFNDVTYVHGGFYIVRINRNRSKT